SASAQVATTILGSLQVGPISIVTRATASPARDGPPICALALNRTAASAISFGGSTVFNGRNCGIYSDSASSSAISLNGSATVTAGGICSVGGYSGSGFTPSPQTHCPVISDPFASIGAPATPGCSYNNKQVQPNQSETLDACLYTNGLTLK